MRSTKGARGQAAALAAHEAVRITAVEQLSAFVRLDRWTQNELHPAEHWTLRVESGNKTYEAVRSAVSL
jgi:hypothetical protein